MEKEIMEIIEEMSDRNINRLIEWLESKGFSKEEIVECIKYITKN